jgi:hypothetical protein
MDRSYDKYSWSLRSMYKNNIMIMVPVDVNGSILLELIMDKIFPGYI